MQINITITSEDYKNYLRVIRNYLRSGDFGRRDSLKAITIRIVSGITIGLVAAYVFRSFGLRLDAFSILFSTLLFVVILVFLTKRHQAKLIPRHEGVLIGTHTFIFDESQISDRTALYETTMSWDATVGYLETNRHFFIFLDTCIGYIIPKRDLGLEDTEQLRELLNTRVKKHSEIIIKF